MSPLCGLDPIERCRGSTLRNGNPVGGAGESGAARAKQKVGGPRGGEGGAIILWVFQTCFAGLGGQNRHEPNSEEALQAASGRFGMRFGESGSRFGGTIMRWSGAAGRHEPGTVHEPGCSTVTCCTSFILLHTMFHPFAPSVRRAGCPFGADASPGHQTLEHPLKFGLPSQGRKPRPDTVGAGSRVCEGMED